MDYEKAAYVLRFISENSDILLELACAMEQANGKNPFPKVKKRKESLDEKIESCMRELKVPDHLKGWDYLLLAVKLRIQNQKKRYDAMDLYKEIAEYYSSETQKETKPKSVERTIRTAMDSTLKQMSAEEVQQYFNSPHITTKKFIIGIAKMVESKN